MNLKNRPPKFNSKFFEVKENKTPTPDEGVCILAKNTHFDYF